ncbi:MAG: hypothetical protein QM704_23355 [Anaeromyxobacteraceae bacterium]
MLVAVLSLLLAGPAVAGPRHVVRCGPGEGEAAYRQLHREDLSWKALHRVHRTHGGCDDGYVAEAFGDAIGAVLEKRWRELEGRAGKLLTDRGFRELLLRHVDAYLSPQQLEAIQRNARERCPAGHAAFCAEVDRRAAVALLEWAKG